MKKVIICLFAVSVVFLSGCVTKPSNIEPVKNFQAKKYLGKWYEIARFDNHFEKGMTNVKAEYSLNSDGSIKVVNSGVNAKTGERTYADGIAKFVGNQDTAFLKVSFFRPFYGVYIVFELDGNYKYAYIAGDDKDYLWLLSRTPTVPKNVKEDFVSKAKKLGYNTSDLIWVKQQ